MNQRKPLTPERRKAIQHHLARIRHHREQYELQIVAAMRDDDASQREVAKAAELSHGQVINLGRKHGWPDQTEQDRRAAEKAERLRNPLGIPDQWRKTDG